MDLLLLLGILTQTIQSTWWAQGHNYGLIRLLDTLKVQLGNQKEILLVRLTKCLIVLKILCQMLISFLFAHLDTSRSKFLKRLLHILKKAHLSELSLDKVALIYRRCMFLVTKLRRKILQFSVLTTFHLFVKQLTMVKTLILSAQRKLCTLLHILLIMCIMHAMLSLRYTSSLAFQFHPFWI